MDYANALNKALGLEETPSFNPSFAKNRKPDERVVKQARQLGKSEAGMLPTPIKREPFDISTYVPNQYLQEALRIFPGSKLNVSPVNGAVEFIFGKQTS